MDHKWAMGAFINILGSISINLGTNLMKLSHKTEGTSDELPPETPGGRWKPLETSPSNAEVGNGIGTLHHHSPQGRPQRHPRCSSLSECAHLQDVEMVTVASADAFDLGFSSRKPSTLNRICGKSFRTDKETSGAGTRIETDLTLESDLGEEETARLIGGDSVTSSPSSANDTSVSFDERAAPLVGSQADDDTLVDLSQGVSMRKTGIMRGGKDFDVRAGVRRRALTNPHTNFVVSEGERSVNGVGILGEDRGGVVRENKALWYTGAILLVVGSLVNFASFGFAPQSLLASLGSVQFVSNIVFGKIILREIVTKRIVIGTVTIIVGNTLTLCFSPHQEDSFDTQQLRAFYDLEYNVLLLVEFTIAIGMHVVYRVFEKSKEQGAPRRYSDVITPLAYAVCSAIVGTQSVIQAKCLSELLKMTFEGENQMTSSFTYVVIAVWFGTTIFWLMRMNRALAMFHGLFIIPALQVFWTLFSVIGGGVYFEEFKSLRSSEALPFALGVLVVFLGVYLLAPRTQTELGKRASEAMRDVKPESEEQGYDLHRMPRLEEAVSSTSPRNGRAMSAHMHRCSKSSSFEDGDEDINWEHTRMLSIGFFPSISTDQDVGRLKNDLRVIEPGKVVQRLKSLKASRQHYKAVSEDATEISPGSARCHDDMPPLSPLTITYVDGTDMPSGDIETQYFGRVRDGDDAVGENLNTGLKSESSTQ